MEWFILPLKLDSRPAKHTFSAQKLKVTKVTKSYRIIL